MLKKYAQAFYGLGVVLELLKTLASSTIDPTDSETPHVTEIANNLFKDELGKALTGCQVCELPVSSQAIQELLNSRQAFCSDPYAASAIQEISNTIRRELGSTFLYLMPRNRLDFYNSSVPFGIEVYTGFPSANFDITEAGKCFALGRDTACVFHVSRVAEIGLKELAKNLGVNESAPSWDGILKKIDNELKKDFKDKQPEWKKDEDFYAEAALHLRTYKNSRNNTQHADKKYTSEEAERIFNAVRDLMKHLSVKLREDGLEYRV